MLAWAAVLICTVLPVTGCQSGAGKSSGPEAVKMIEAASAAKDYARLQALADSLGMIGKLSKGESYYWQGYAGYQMSQREVAEYYWQEAIRVTENSTDPNDLVYYAKSGSYLTSQLCRYGEYASALHAALPIINRLEKLQCDTTSDYTNLLIFAGCSKTFFDKDDPTATDMLERAYQMHIDNIQKKGSKSAYRDAVAGLINIAYIWVLVNGYEEGIFWSERLMNLVEKYKEMFPDKYPYLMDGQAGRWADEPWCPDWAGMGTNSVAMKMAKDADGNFDETIYSIFATPEQEEHIRLMYKWGQAGYISPDAALTSFDYNGTFGRGDFLVFSQPLKGNGIKAAEMYAANATAEFECVEITMQPKYVVTTHAGGSMFAIPVTCKNPEAAMKYLNLMHSDATLVNLMLFGEEGVNYTKVDDQKVELIEDANWYGMHGGAWTVGNTKLQYVLTTEDPEKNAKLQEYADDAVMTASYGFRLDKKKAEDLIKPVEDVVKIYARPLMVGAVDPDDPEKGLEAFRKALKDAGIDALKEEVEAQYDTWRTLTKK